MMFQVLTKKIENIYQNDTKKDEQNKNKENNFFIELIVANDPKKYFEKKKYIF
jgi:hypothetical protein